MCLLLSYFLYFKIELAVIKLNKQHAVKGRVPKALSFVHKRPPGGVLEKVFTLRTLQVCVCVFLCVCICVVVCMCVCAFVCVCMNVFV